jgi:hypothetical protein
MFEKTKSRISMLMDTISEYLGVLYKLNDKPNAIADCLAAFEVIHSQLDNEKTSPLKTIEHLESLQTSFRLFFNDTSLINENSIESLN